ncbi:MAG: Hsp20/alpha crystallin family protein [Coxiellaceae bacterium]|jgi:HSP20 family molecular chaperone IbpA|nr:Hsp20/alpha crystallin family protein [Coxiellaceae bacterium]
MNSKDIKVYFDKYNNLVIEGNRNNAIKEERNYLYLERARGVFIRRLFLPGAMIDHNIKAKYQDSVLEIRVPITKIDTLTPVKIE